MDGSARIHVRQRDIVDAVEKSAVAFQAIFDTKIRYSISSGIGGETEVLAVICPLVSEAMSDSEQALEAAASTWRTRQNYSDWRPRQRLENGAMTKA